MVDANKGLGGCIIPREWVDTELSHLLGNGGARFGPDVYKTRNFEARCLLERVTKKQLRTLEGFAIVNQKTIQHVFALFAGILKLILMIGALW